MWVGALFISRITSPEATFALLLLLLSMHLACNYRAVKSVVITYLNRQRANIVFSHWIAHGQVLTPKDVAAREKIWSSGVMRYEDHVVGSCKIGVSFQEMLSDVRSCCPRRGNGTAAATVCRSLLEMFDASTASYIVWVDHVARRGCIALRPGGGPDMQLLAWYTVFLALKDTQPITGRDSPTLAMNVASLEAIHTSAKCDFKRLEKALEMAGWDIANTALQTTDRVTVDWQL